MRKKLWRRTRLDQPATAARLFRTCNPPPTGRPGQVRSRPPVTGQLPTPPAPPVSDMPPRQATAPQSVAPAKAAAPAASSAPIAAAVSVQTIPEPVAPVPAAILQAEADTAPVAPARARTGRRAGCRHGPPGRGRGERRRIGVCQDLAAPGLTSRLRAINETPPPPPRSARWTRSSQNAVQMRTRIAQWTGSASKACPDDAHRPCRVRSGRQTPSPGPFHKLSTTLPKPLVPRLTRPEPVAVEPVPVAPRAEPGQAAPATRPGRHALPSVAGARRRRRAHRSAPRPPSA